MTLARDGSEVGQGGHCDKGRHEVLGLDALPGQTIQVGGVHIPDPSPSGSPGRRSAAVVSSLLPWDGVAAQDRQRQQQLEGFEPCHPTSTCHALLTEFMGFSLFSPLLNKVHINNSAQLCCGTNNPECRKVPHICRTG